MDSLHQGLPNEVIFFHILPRVPAKSLMRFRCVCKSWSSLTRNPLFITTHRKNFNRNQHTYLLLTTWDSAARQLHFLSVQINQKDRDNPAHATLLLSLPTPPSDIRSLHINALPCNGLICIYSSRNECSFPAYIYNPCTQESLVLFSKKKKKKESLVLPHSPPMHIRVHVSHHFGYSPTSDEYKVLRVQKGVTRPPRRLMFEVFTLGTSSWRRIEVDRKNLPFNLIHFQFNIRGVGMHGAIHWIHVGRSNNVLVVFDIRDERFKTIPLPEDFFNYGVEEWKSKSKYTGNVVEVGGCVALFGYDDMLFWQQKKIELWILKDYDNQVWVKETIIYPFAWCNPGYAIPFCTLGTGELILQSSTMFTGKDTVRRDLKHVWVRIYDMKYKSVRRSKIVLPGWTFPRGAELEFLASYDDTIISLR